MNMGYWFKSLNMFARHVYVLILPSRLLTNGYSAAVDAFAIAITNSIGIASAIAPFDWVLLLFFARIHRLFIFHLVFVLGCIYRSPFNV